MSLCDEGSEKSLLQWMRYRRVGNAKRCWERVHIGFPIGPRGLRGGTRDRHRQRMLYPATRHVDAETNGHIIKTKVSPTWRSKDAPEDSGPSVPRTRSESALCTQRKGASDQSLYPKIHEELAPGIDDHAHLLRGFRCHPLRPEAVSSPRPRCSRSDAPRTQK